jgi:hypothetical protein
VPAHPGSLSGCLSVCGFPDIFRILRRPEYFDSSSESDVFRRQSKIYKKPQDRQQLVGLVWYLCRRFLSSCFDFIPRVFSVSQFCLSCHIHLFCIHSYTRSRNRRRVDCNPVSYSGGPGFVYRHRHQTAYRASYVIYIYTGT